VIALVALLLLAAPSPAMPEDPGTKVMVEQLSHGLPAAEVGQWVTYQLMTEQGRRSFWRLAVVGNDRDAKGRDAAWVEMEFSETAKMVAPLFQMRMLVARNGGLDANAISRVFVAAGVGKPMELDPKSVAQMYEKPPATAIAEPATRKDAHVQTGKPEQLMTLAGTLNAVPIEVMYRKTVVERFWMSKQIPVLQLAKVEIPGIETGMEVRDYGLDARPMMRLPDPNETKLTLDSPGGDTHAPSQP
jgi:hypothetical protein